MGDRPPWRKGLLEVMVSGRGAAMTGISRATQVEPVRGVSLSADAPPTNASTKDEVSAWSPFRHAASAVLWTATEPVAEARARSVGSA